MEATNTGNRSKDSKPSGGVLLIAILAVWLLSKFFGAKEPGPPAKASDGAVPESAQKMMKILDDNRYHNFVVDRFR